MGIINLAFTIATGLAGVRRVRIRAHERALLWRDKEFVGVIGPSRRWLFDPLGRYAVEVQSRLTPWLRHNELPAMIKSGRLPEDEVGVVELVSTQRALVWLDGRFSGVLTPGRWAWWKGLIDVRIETFDIRENFGRLDHPELDAILALAEATRDIDSFVVPAGARTAFFHHGTLVELLEPGRYAFWSALSGNGFHPVDLREQTMDIGGQDMLTADKLALRLNISVSYRVVDAVKSFTAAADTRQALYREAQLLLRGAVGARELDALLADRDSLAGELEKAISGKAATYGFEVVSFGVKDIILPGDIKAILNKVVEAKKASEAATITRREETASMRHQLNTARILAENPVLMRLRELETAEKVVAGSRLKVILGDKGLAQQVASLV